MLRTACKTSPTYPSFIEPITSGVNRSQVMRPTNCSYWYQTFNSDVIFDTLSSLATTTALSPVLWRLCGQSTESLCSSHPSGVQRDGHDQTRFCRISSQSRSTQGGPRTDTRGDQSAWPPRVSLSDSVSLLRSGFAPRRVAPSRC